MPGEERLLGLEMLDALTGREPRTSAWKKGAANIAMLLVRGGSGNIGLLRMAVKLLRQGRKWRGWWLEFFAASRATWMGRELWSRIYRVWHLLAVLAAFRWARQNGDEELRAAAAEWLRAFFVFLRAATAQDGTVAPVGMRSADDPGEDDDFEPGVQEVIAALALAHAIGDAETGLLHWAETVGGGSIAALRGAADDDELQEKRALYSNAVQVATRRVPVSVAARDVSNAVKRYDYAAWVRWERAAAYYLVADIRLAAQAPREAVTLDDALDLWPEGFGCMTAVWFAWCEGFHALWFGHNLNSNTPPVLGGVWEPDPGWETLPPEDQLYHRRQEHDDSTAQLDGAELVVYTEFYGPGGRPGTYRRALQFEALPPRQLGVRRPPPGDPPPDPKPPAPPPRLSWLDRLRLWWAEVRR
jgi:hypothetical protein